MYVVQDSSKNSKNKNTQIVLGLKVKKFLLWTFNIELKKTDVFKYSSSHYKDFGAPILKLLIKIMWLSSHDAFAIRKQVYMI